MEKNGVKKESTQILNGEKIDEKPNGVEALSEVQEFYNKKNVFITGATGFLGKVLMEKLLRSCQGLENLYILVRQKRGKDIYTRMEETFDNPVFDRLKEEVPKFRHKVVVVQGDCDVAGLGLTISDRQMLVEKVNVVFHSAATVKFDEHLRIALNTNVKATLSLLDLAKEMKHLKSFMHISTAFSNPFVDPIDEKIYPFNTTFEELQTTMNSLTDREIDEQTSKLISKWPNTYTYTKALTENELLRKFELVPLSIFRPAIVSSTAKEPVTCWVDNMYGPTGVAVGCVTGILRTMHCDPNLTAEIVPVDYVVNCLIVAALSVSKIYSKSPPAEPPVFNYVTYPANNLTWLDFNILNFKMIDTYPSSNAIWYMTMQLSKNYYVHQIYKILLHFVPAVLIDGLAVCVGKKAKMLKVYHKIHKFLNVLSYFSTTRFNFCNERTNTLWVNTSSLDKKLFPFDMGTFDWHEYLKNYLIGIRKYLLKESDDTLPEARKRWKRLYYLHQIVYFAFIFLASYAFGSFILRLI